LLTVAAFSALALTVPAVAQDAPGPMGPMFAQFDTDGDGNVTREEFDAFRTSRFTAADSNSDGKLDQAEMQAQAETMQAEMLARMAENLKADAPKRIAHMMIDLDTDSDGFLSPEEAAAMGHEKMFDRMDANGDGTVSAEEAAAARAGMRGGMGRDHGGNHERGEGRGWFGFWRNGHH
jgi:Ca2+-binding EF-hand superfamily protein